MDFIEGLLFRFLETMALLSILTVVKSGQERKADSPMLVTLLGMVMEVRPLQLPKARIPMLVTLLGMVMEVRPLQP